MTLAKGTIFAIKRFALHDGGGIRTTVFFKGCPLHCSWCHNPEGLKPARELVFIKNNCISCKRCLSLKTDDQISGFDDHPRFNFVSSADFTPLVQNCPSNAIVTIGETKTTSQLLEIIKSDQVFYQENGGVTFSGGEPLMQADFLETVLKECHSEDINTAIETSLYAPLNKIIPILDFLDTIYIDLKIFDSFDHLLHTGVSNETILKNIAYILRSPHKDKVIIRTPLIPGITASVQNIKAIANFIYGCYPGVKYELLNYNYLAEAKYENLETDFKLERSLEPLCDSELEKLYEAIQEAGITNLIKVH